MSIFFVSQLLFYLRITHFVWVSNEIELLNDDTLEYYVTEVVDTKGLWIPISLNYFFAFIFVIAFFKTQYVDIQSKNLEKIDDEQLAG